MLWFGFRYVPREEICLLAIIATGFMERLKLACNKSLIVKKAFIFCPIDNKRVGFCDALNAHGGRARISEYETASPPTISLQAHGHDRSPRFSRCEFKEYSRGAVDCKAEIITEAQAYAKPYGFKATRHACRSYKIENKFGGRLIEPTADLFSFVKRVLPCTLLTPRFHVGKRRSKAPKAEREHLPLIP